MATVVCEKHGLRFDPERSSGCVLCRREQGGEAAAPAAAAPAARAGQSVLPAVALTLVIWVIGGVLLFSAHNQAVESLRAWGFGAPVDPYGDPTGYDPSGWDEDPGAPAGGEGEEPAYDYDDGSDEE